MLYERLDDEDRKKIAPSYRCEVSYNGFHQWKKKDSESVFCMKCLEIRRIDNMNNKE
jgi:hypothetical protein